MVHSRQIGYDLQIYYEFSLIYDCFHGNAGTVKEYKNRFVNPIMNGSCADSRSFDVKLMKQRAHILHELLDG